VLVVDFKVDSKKNVDTKVDNKKRRLFQNKSTLSRLMVTFQSTLFNFYFKISVHLDMKFKIINIIKINEMVLYLLM
jgi:hypothetical protein